MNVFVDTSAFYAVLDGGDRRSGAAMEAWSFLIEGTHMLHTTNYILVETFALLQHRLGLEAVNAFVADVLPVVETHWVEQATHLSAVHALLVASRRQLSLVDCVSFESMRRLGLVHVFCFDVHYAEQGFTVIPGGAVVTGPTRRTHGSDWRDRR